MSETRSERDDELTIAWFESMQQVRAAEIALEQHGIDSVHIEVAGASPVDERRTIDRRAAGWAGRRAAIGAVLGAAIGALVGLLVGLVLVDDGNDVVAYVIGVALFGFWAGFFYGFATRLPTGPGTFDTFGGDGETADDRNWIAVEGPPEVRRDAAGVLEGMRPLKLAPSS